MLRFNLMCFVFSQLTAQSQSYIDRYLTDPLVYTTIGSSSQGVNQPRDLDFKPNSNELWVANYGTSSGGSTVIFFNAGKTNQISQYRKDSHSGHFMPYPSAIAFSENGEWANTNEIKSTASANSTFMGPALWSGDTALYARIFQNNWAAGFPLGSHVDMLHQSPFSMGIASDSAKVYWVFDGWNGNLCKYDYVTDHGPGYDNHSAGRIWRYTDISLTRVAGIPSHMVLDHSSNWLYIVNGGPKQIIRMNTFSGTVGANIPVPGSGGEPLNLYKAVTGAVTQTLDTYTGTSQPCGIEYSNGRVLVGDYSTGDIRIYDATSTTFSLMGTIATGQPGIMGIKVGHDGKIWFVNRTQSTVVRIDPQPLNNDISVNAVIYPTLANTSTNFHSINFDQCGTSMAPIVEIKNVGSNSISSAIVNYKIDNGAIVSFTYTGSLASNATATVTLPSSIFSSGEHKIEVFTSLPNTNLDSNPINDILQGSFRSRALILPLPFLEDFTSPLFPPSGWSYLGFNKFAEMSRNPSVGGNGIGLGCLQIDNVSGGVDISGQTDHLITPLINFSNTEAGTTLVFDVAHAQYNQSSMDSLQVSASVDCGATWIPVYGKKGPNLATVPNPVTSVFVPEVFDWRNEQVNLDAFVGEPEVLFAFTSTSDFGNNVYVDNIYINYVNTVGLPKLNSKNEMAVFPNPASDKITVQTHNAINSIEIITALGTVVKIVPADNKTKEIQVDVSDLKTGTYLIRTSTEGNVYHKKIVIQASE